MNDGNVAADQLRLFIERIERLEEEKKGIGADITDVYQEAKSDGFDNKTMRAIIKLRAMTKAKRDEADALLETYRIALGMAEGETPIERAIREKEESISNTLETVEDIMDKMDRRNRTKGSVEGSLADKVADKLEGAGFTREPGTNKFTAPADFDYGRKQPA